MFFFFFFFFKQKTAYEMVRSDWSSDVCSSDLIEVHGSAEPRAGWSLFQQGALSALTNPKALLFFTAFLPQFIDPARSLFVQFVIMAGTFAVLEIATEVFIANMAHRINPWLRRAGRRFNQACGGVFMAIGIALPLRS